jgi:CRISPR type III-B/RAMP module-associated protein Cmr5
MNIEKVIVSNALECIENIIRNISNERAKRSFRSRARDIPSDLFTRGPTYTMVYIAARSNVHSLNIAFAASDCKQIVEYINKSDMKPEEKGYALYGAVVIHILKQIGLIKARNFTELINETLTNPVLYNYFNAIAEWIKRFAEGYIEIGSGD